MPFDSGTLCEACGGTCQPFLSALDVNRRISNDVFQYFRCSACGVVFLKDPPADLGRYYQSDYFAMPGSLGDLERIGRRMQPKLDIVREFANGDRLLEIGPGMGTFAWLAKSAGFAVDVIEQDEEACRFLESTVHVGVTRSSSPEQVLAASNRKYDVVALWHSIEHLPAAWRTLTQAIRALNEGGVLIVATPNPSAWQFQHLGAKWPHVDAPRHLWLIPVNAMRRYVEQSGADLIWSTTDDPEGRSWNQFGWSQLLRNLLPAAFRNNFMIRVASRAAGFVTALAVRPWESKEFSGSAYTAVFRKRPGSIRQEGTL
jgi:SAM-dependent methyltransferase